MPISDVLTKDSSVHLGQVGQPKPEPVSRTKPPVTTMRIWVARESQTYSLSRAGEVRRSSQRFLTGVRIEVNLGMPY